MVHSVSRRPENYISAWFALLLQLKSNLVFVFVLSLPIPALDWRRSLYAMCSMLCFSFRLKLPFIFDLSIKYIIVIAFAMRFFVVFRAIANWGTNTIHTTYHIGVCSFVSNTDEKRSRAIYSAFYLDNVFLSLLLGSFYSNWSRANNKLAKQKRSKANARCDTNIKNRQPAEPGKVQKWCEWIKNRYCAIRMHNVCRFQQKIYVYMHNVRAFKRFDLISHRLECWILAEPITLNTDALHSTQHSITILI